MPATPALLLIGFSIVALAILLAVYLRFMPGVQKSWPGQVACVVLCAALAGLQWAHLGYLQGGVEPLAARHYLVLLFVTPAAFYFFSRDVLLPGVPVSPRAALHLVPPLAAFWMPPPWAVPAAFVIGAGYSVWLARVVHGMRRQVKRFRFEMFFFALFAVIALAVLGLVVAMPWLGTHGFYLAYAGSIGLAVALVTAALLAFPELPTDLAEAAKLSYANSTLGGVDVAARLADLDRLMATDKLFRDETLTLASLAEAAGLSAHQLSELVNTRFGMGFPRYVRELRVAEARRLLAEDRRSSVLSIGMMCGFGSQSTFYAAFREATGQSPAAFRKQHGGSGAPE